MVDFEASFKCIDKDGMPHMYHVINMEDIVFCADELNLPEPEDEVIYAEIKGTPIRGVETFADVVRKIKEKLTIKKASELLKLNDFDNWKHPWLARVANAVLEYLSLDGLEDAMRASEIPDEILEICEEELTRQNEKTGR